MKSLAQARVRRSEAVRLAAEGLTYEAIAQRVGYAHRASAFKAVTKALHDHEVEDLQQFRGIEMARLDKLLSALWPKVESGDIAAISTAVRVTEARLRLAGVDGREVRDEARYLVQPPAS